MVETYHDLSVLVDELRCCFEQYKEDVSVTEHVKTIIRPWIDNPEWLEEKYMHCKTEEDIYPLYQGGADDILITVICWRKGEVSCVHDHRTWAVIGIVQGQETHQIWRRTDDRSKQGYAEIEPTNRMTLGEGQIISLPEDGIHSVVNDSDLDTTIAIHVYGGDLEKIGRNQYFPDENRMATLHSMK